MFKGLSPKKHAGTVSMFGKYYVKEGLVEEYYGKTLTKAFQMRSKA
ncbi:hypothetical protein [Thermococcus sp.]|nr:hypothetical protein [Thermococcus sp.]